MDVFYSSDLQALLHNKFVVIIGDSIQRGIYKDLVLLLQEDRFLREKELRDKGEYSFLHDELIEGGRKGEMTNGVKYSEVRQYSTNVHLIRFYFVTRSYNAYVESILSDLQQEPYPDIVMMNSCLWDITRYGKASIVDYKKNLITLFDRFKEVLPDDCLMIWNTTLPISNQARGGFLIPEIEFRTTTLRLDVLEANYYARSIIVERGFNVLDLHFYLRNHIDKRVRDGIHWDMMAHRYITNLLLTHVSKAFNRPIPKHKPAPFSSYPHRTTYAGAPLLNDFSNPEFTSSPIQQQYSSERNEYNDDEWQQQPVVQAYSKVTNMFSSMVNCCMPAMFGTNYPNDNRNFRQGWHSSWTERKMRSNEVCGHDPYRGHGAGPYNRNHGKQNRDFCYGSVSNAGYQTFPSPVFPSGLPFNGVGHNNMYSPSFQPYQQNDHQGASYNKKRSRNKPYKRTY